MIIYVKILKIRKNFVSLKIIWIFLYPINQDLIDWSSIWSYGLYQPPNPKINWISIFILVKVFIYFIFLLNLLVKSYQLLFYQNLWYLELRLLKIDLNSLSYVFTFPFISFSFSRSYQHISISLIFFTSKRD